MCPSDDRLQEIVYEKSALWPGEAGHIRNCDQCQAQLAAYAEMSAWLSESQPPAIVAGIAGDLRVRAICRCVEADLRQAEERRSLITVWGAAAAGLLTVLVPSITLPAAPSLAFIREWVIGRFAPLQPQLAEFAQSLPQQALLLAGLAVLILLVDLPSLRQPSRS